MQEIMFSNSISHAAPSAVRSKSFRIISHHEAMRHLLTSMAGKSLPEHAQAELRAIVSHWLQSPEGDPLFLGKKMGKDWRTQLAAYADFSWESVTNSRSRKKSRNSNLIIDCSAIPFPPVEKPKFTFIDLFAGIGGFRIALQSLGGKCKFSSEWDRPAQRTYEKNFGETPFGDIRGFTGGAVSNSQIDRLIPDHHVLAAGFPCQPFSKAGVSARKALGYKHGFSCEIQGTLFFDVVRIAKVKQPQVLLLENVKHLRGHDGGRTFQKIKETIEKDLKYSFHYDILDASTLVPQRRQRCYIICFRRDLARVSDFSFPLLMGSPRALDEILLKEPAPRYTISDRLWAGHQNRTARNLKRGAGFTAFLADPGKPANTLVARYYKDGKECLVPQSGGRNPRKLTPRECARLQGFPEEFILGNSDTQAYRQFGNSVAIPVVRKIAEEIVKQLKEE